MHLNFLITLDNTAIIKLSKSPYISFQCRTPSRFSLKFRDLERSTPKLQGNSSLD
ncbi:hypothetical protein PAHAL_7G306000 [Panicum hallii]|uniref:Uncharacterized protein n=1 Tax=Panicum hallii TaxID=206008 RepID=A0A2T8IE19_9POAL|nr:hypothetical protein PAHAL_7G306000 [Panicum hallii]